AGTQVSDAGLAHFKGCKDLTRLHLAHAKKVRGTGLVHLKGCKNLTQLWLNESDVSDAGLAHVKNFENLKFLNRGLTQVSDAGLDHLEGCKNLTELLVPQTKVTAKGIDKLKKALPRCKIEWDGGVLEPVVAKPSADAAAWERSVAAMPADEQVKAVSARLKELNRGFDGTLTPTIEK